VIAAPGAKRSAPRSFGRAPVLWERWLRAADAFPRLDPGDDLVQVPADRQRAELDSGWEFAELFQPPGLRITERDEIPQSGPSDDFSRAGFRRIRQLYSPLRFTASQWRERLRRAPLLCYEQIFSAIFCSRASPQANGRTSQ
jgi:hypothetical protein